MNLVNLFDSTYPQDKQMEAIAISQAVVTGECFKCPHYKRCSTDKTFSFPQDSACMKLKKKLLI